MSMPAMPPPSGLLPDAIVECGAPQPPSGLPAICAMSNGELLVDGNVLQQLAAHLRSSWTAATPFAHVVIDQLFPNSTAAAAWASFPNITTVGQPPDHLRSIGWLGSSSSNPHETKFACCSAPCVPSAPRTVYVVLRSPAFSAFLRSLSGLDDLQADPIYLGSGLHMIARGGKLKLHADFNLFDVAARGTKGSMKGWRRRLNTFLYFGAGPSVPWEPTWNGDLELWNRNMTACARTIAPSFNRFVAFASSDYSYHGHPHTLASPSTVQRKSLALYYYTPTRPSVECFNEDCETPHPTAWQDPKPGAMYCDASSTGLFKRFANRLAKFAETVGPMVLHHQNANHGKTKGYKILAKHALPAS